MTFKDQYGNWSGLVSSCLALFAVFMILIGVIAFVFSLVGPGLNVIYYPPDSNAYFRGQTQQIAFVFLLIGLFFGIFSWAVGSLEKNRYRESILASQVMQSL